MARKRKNRKIASTKKTKAKTPEEFIANARKQQLETIQTYIRSTLDIDHVTEDLDHLITTIRALIVTNMEIWERCNKNRVKKHKDDKASAGLSFCRFGFFSVKIGTITSASEIILQFTTSCHFEFKSVNNLPLLPTVLTDIVGQPKYLLPDVPVLDFEHLLQLIVLLDQMILKHALIVYKKYLQDFQIALGDIDSWLLEPAQNVTFLNKRFGKTIKIPEHVGCANSRTPRHRNSSICDRCFNNSSYPYRHICPGNANNHSCSYAFINDGPIILKAIKMREGNITKTFDLSKERDYLKNFLAFVETT